VSETIIPQADLRITNAALGGHIEKPGARSSVQITYGKSPKDEDDDGEEDEEDDEEDEDEKVETKTTILCSLTPGSVYFSLLTGIGLSLILPKDRTVLARCRPV
jgi:FK506-binding nuclear protein